MQTALSEFGYRIVGVEVSGCLHLKSAATLAAPKTFLINPNWVDKNQFAKVNFIEIDEREPYAANGLLIGESVIYPMALPKTRQWLEEHGIKLLTVEADELAKAEGAVTCCGLILN